MLNGERERARKGVRRSYAMTFCKAVLNFSISSFVLGVVTSHAFQMSRVEPVTTTVEAK